MSHLICRGICPKYRAKRPAKGLGRYDIGQRRCQACEMFIEWDGLWCPCCKGRLRTVARNKNKCVREEPVIKKLVPKLGRKKLNRDLGVEYEE